MLGLRGRDVTLHVPVRTRSLPAILLNLSVKNGITPVISSPFNFHRFGIQARLPAMGGFQLSSLCGKFLLIDEVITPRAVTVTISWPNGRTRFTAS